MSKFSEEFERQHQKIGKLKKDTKSYKAIEEKEEIKRLEKNKYWIHREERWGFDPKLNSQHVKKKDSYWRKNVL